MVFREDGYIAYGWYDQEGQLIKGFRWDLNDDGTYDKKAVKYLGIKIEENENDDERRRDDSDED